MIVKTDVSQIFTLKVLRFSSSLTYLQSDEIKIKPMAKTSNINLKNKSNRT